MLLQYNNCDKPIIGGESMCEIFCFNSNTPKQINECLECFYNHSEDHPHGWGLATMKSNEFVIKKEPVKATCSQNLKRHIVSSCGWEKRIRSHQVSYGR